MFRDVADLLSHEYKFQLAFGTALFVFREIFEHRRAVLALVDPSHVNDIIAVNAEFFTE